MRTVGKAPSLPAHPHLLLRPSPPPQPPPWRPRVMLPSQAWAHCLSSWLGSRGPRTRSPARPSTANTATKNTSAWVPSRCTSEATRCPAFVAPAGRRSPGPGCYRAMSGPTPGRSRSPAPTAAGPSPTALTCGLISRPTRTSRSTSARHAPGPFPACLCSTNTKSQAAQGAPADSQVPSCFSRPPGVASPNSARKDAHILLTTLEFSSELPFWPCWPHRTLRTIFQSSLLWGSRLFLKEAFQWTFLWTADGRVACSGDPFWRPLLQAFWSWPCCVGLCIQSYLDTAALSYRTKADRLIGGFHPTQGTPLLPPRNPEAAPQEV